MSKDLNLLPILIDFSDLRMGDKIHSRRFGLGEFVRLYQNEAVIRFPDRQIRIAPEEKDISLAWKNTRKRGRNKMSGEVEGEKMSFGKMKQMMAQNITESFVPTKVAISVLSINQKKLISLCEIHNIEITKFGIIKEDLIKLNKLLTQK